MFKYLSLLLLFSTFSLSSNACVVLLYHHFDEHTPKSTSISPALFEQHLHYLKTNDFKVLTTKELIKTLKKGEKLPNKCAVLTTDDAYTSIYTNAYPLLKKYQMPMSVFVATEGIEDNYQALMSYEQMRNTSDMISYYNHSQHHEHFYTLTTEQAKTSIENAQKSLHKNLGVVDKIFAYPYGEFDEKTYNLVKNMGYAGFGQHSGVIHQKSDIVRLPRFPMTDTYGSMKNFITKVNALSFDIINTQPISQIVTTNPPTLRIQFSKKYNLNCFVSGQAAPNIIWKNTIAHITAQELLPKGRTKYNCTAPSSQKGRFYWTSKQWIVL